MYKNILHVEPTICGSQIKLSITLNFCFDADYEECFNGAFSKLESFVSLRGSGAPTLNKISISGFYVDAPAFPNNEYARNEAKEFLIELDNFLTIVVDLHEKLLSRRKLEDEQKKAEQERKNKEEKKLSDFFNN